MSWRDPSFRYVPVRDQGDGYLKRKFDKMRLEKRRLEEKAIADAKAEADRKAAQEAADEAERQAKVRRMSK